MKQDVAHLWLCSKQQKCLRGLKTVLSAHLPVFELLVTDSFAPLQPCTWKHMRHQTNQKHSYI